eukprot:CAMPEP_0173382004 /NCGR_PEP_ID=MMETSP1356-20130122/4443_1 /TAXON_ID=77927 ORGANISM="Hemiselmis virescens, Strain PCC157" /NCGR_SAMPLE_ID=MMETSP1356 /ASSEMBLY_ACC=CAM_ASM_000847 /LENGTH=346 /DNA_ID=CAMNT_0014336117 /DNA_START=69 /DNA_END=1109 /DNA_ORIENTATION=-
MSFSVTVFSHQKYDNNFLIPALKLHCGEAKVKTLPIALSTDTVELAGSSDAVCLFVNDIADKDVLTKLNAAGCKLILLRNAGFNNVDLEVAGELGMSVRRVPAYSPYAVAEMAVALLLAVVRKIPKAYNRVREHNFSISGLEGFDIRGKKIGILGTGNIGKIAAGILKGFGPSRLMGHDAYPSDECKAMGLEYVSLEELCQESDIISIHVPLFPSTYHIIGKETLAMMKPNVVIINTSRGGLVDAEALVDALKKNKIGGLAMDVYEHESSFFFHDCSDQVFGDDVLSRLLSFNNVIITAHQAFLTKEALEQISLTTVQNIIDFSENTSSRNEVKPVPKIDAVSPTK